MVNNEKIPEKINIPEIIYVNFLLDKKLNFKLLNRPFVRGVEKFSLDPRLTSQLINNLEIKIAVNNEVIIPINRVVAKPLIGPVPKVYKINAVNPVVIFASRIDESAF